MKNNKKKLNIKDNLIKELKLKIEGLNNNMLNLRNENLSLNTNINSNKNKNKQCINKFEIDYNKLKGEYENLLENYKTTKENNSKFSE